MIAIVLGTDMAKHANLLAEMQVSLVGTASSSSSLTNSLLSRMGRRPAMTSYACSSL